MARGEGRWRGDCRYYRNRNAEGIMENLSQKSRATRVSDAELRVKMRKKEKRGEVKEEKKSRRRVR